MRYKVDWDNVDPGGNNGTQNKITTNGGVIVDTRINIHGAKANISLAQGVEAGTLTLADGTALNATPSDFGKAVRVVAHPADGKSLLSIVVKHGYNLNGAQLLNGNRQWEETTVDADAASPNTCLLDGSLLDGDVQLTPVFAKAGTSYIPVEDHQVALYDMFTEEEARAMEADPNLNLEKNPKLKDAIDFVLHNRRS